MAEPDPPEERRFGWLDGAGLIAGVALAVIVADILSDGRLISARLIRRMKREPREGDGGDPDGQH